MEKVFLVFTVGCVKTPFDISVDMSAFEVAAVI